MKCLMLTWRLESGQFSHKIFCFIHLSLNLCMYTCFLHLQPFCITLDFKLFIDSIHILFLLYLLLWFWSFTIKNLQDFIKIYRALIKDILLILQVTHILTDSRSRRKFREHRKLLNLCAHTEVCLIDRKRFLQPLENLSPSRTVFYNLLHLFLQKFLFA